MTSNFAFVDSIVKSAGVFQNLGRSIIGKTSRIGSRGSVSGGAGFAEAAKGFKAGRDAKAFGAAMASHNKPSGLGTTQSARHAINATPGSNWTEKRNTWATDTRKGRTYGRAALTGLGVVGTGYLLHKMRQNRERNQ